MMMGGGARTGTRIRPATTLGLPGYKSRQSGAGNKKETVGGANKKKKSPGKSVAANLLDVLKGQSPTTNRKKSQEGGGRSGSGGGRGGVIGSSVTLSRGAPGLSGLGGSGAAGKGSGQEVGQDCGFSGNRVCSGQKQEIFDNIELDNLFSGSIIESFQFGIVKVCVNGKIELRRKQDVANDVTIRDKVKLGGGE